MQHRFISGGALGAQPPAVVSPIVLHVGPTRPFKTISSAVDSVRKLVATDQILIKVDDGVYDEPSFYFNEKNISGRLFIVGNLDTPANCVINPQPNPSLSAKLGWFNKTTDTQQGSGTGINFPFNVFSYGFVADQQFILYLGGFTINGAMNYGTNVTHAGLYALNGGVIHCYDGTMIVDGGYHGAVLDNQGTIYARSSTLKNSGDMAIRCFYRSTGYFSGANLIGGNFSNPGNLQTAQSLIFLTTVQNYSITQLPFNCSGDLLVPGALYNQFISRNTNSDYQNLYPVVTLPFSVSDNSTLYLTYASVSNFDSRGGVYYNSTLQASNSSFSNIGYTFQGYGDIGCVTAEFNSTAIIQYGTFNNVVLPGAYFRSTVDISYIKSATSIVVPSSSIYVPNTSTTLALSTVGKIPTGYYRGLSNGVIDTYGNVIYYN